jgi:hypothetical protein
MNRRGEKGFFKPAIYDFFPLIARMIKILSVPFAMSAKGSAKQNPRARSAPRIHPWAGFVGQR